MRRREFITLLGGAAGWPMAAWALEADRMRRVGVLIGFPENDKEAQSRVAAFQQGFKELAWTEGSNVRIDYRWAGSNLDRLQLYAAELLALTPDVVLTANTLTLATLQKATRSIPIVFVQVTDPGRWSLRRELVAPWRQHNRLHVIRVFDCRQVAGVTQRDYAEYQACDGDAKSSERRLN